MFYHIDIQPEVVNLIAEAIADKCMLVLWEKYQDEVGGKSYGMLLRGDQSRKRNFVFCLKVESSNHNDTQSALHNEFLTYLYVASHRSRRANAWQKQCEKLPFAVRFSSSLSLFSLVFYVEQSERVRMP